MDYDRAVVKVMEQPVYNYTESDVELVFVADENQTIEGFDETIKYVGEWDLKARKPHGFGVTNHLGEISEGYVNQIQSGMSCSL